MRHFLCLVFIFLVFISCGTLDKAKLNDVSIRKKVDPLSLDIGYDVYLLRIDLNRATHAESRTTCNQNGCTTSTVQVPNSYHYITVDFGNGIIMDYNGNLCLDLARYYRFSNSKDFSILEKNEGLFGTEIAYDKAAANFKMETRAFLGAKSEFDLSSNPIKSKEGSYIALSNNSVGFGPGFLGLGKVTINKPDQKTVVMPQFWQESKFMQISDSLITLNDQMKISNAVDHIEFTYSGIFGIKTSYSFIKTATGFYFYNMDNYSGIEMERNGNKIIVSVNGSKVRTYTINTVSSN
ncbi:MAG: hypothetical protein HZC28_09085 [Spirochaetes bacterium]|nr:hypothetical protein [Spirochaetota bacterium]